MYADGEYDLAGFAVGVVERAKILDGSRARPGDLVLGVASSGLHSNGYSLARRVLLEELKLELGAELPGTGQTVGQALLTPTRIYTKTVAALLAALGDDARALCHVTGGGLPENLPRVLPAGLGAELDLSTFERPAIFRAIQDGGPVLESEMLRTFNVGVGLVVVVAASAAPRALEVLAASGERAFPLGTIVEIPEGERVRFR
jgi:phosphoribosylformylglycinamidine cyclo-ligase